MRAPTNWPNAKKTKRLTNYSYHIGRIVPIDEITNFQGIYVTPTCPCFDGGWRDKVA